MATRRTATLAEVSLVQLRNCLVNLPTSLASLLENSHIPVQNCIVELQYRAPNASQSSAYRSIYVGWTGFNSKSKSSLVSTRHSNREQSYTSSTGPIDVPTVELDISFARTLSVTDGAKVGVVLHPDPPVAHTVHIEPQTPADWDIIELHATFLETNLLAQIRALPNPQYLTPGSQKSEKSEEKRQTAHPLTIHLSPTSTANVVVTQLTPAVPKDIPYAKISAESEVIVAPKTRTQAAPKGDNRSVVSGSVRSGRTSVTHRQRSQRNDTKAPVFMRAVSEDVISASGTNQEVEGNGLESDRTTQGSLCVWIDSDFRLSSKSIRTAEWVTVSIVTPTGLQQPMDAQTMQKIKDIDASESGPGANKVVAKLLSWDSAPTRTCSVLSSQLCAALGETFICGGVIRLDPAPSPATDIRAIKIYPFSASQVKHSEGLKFGGESRASREAAATRFRTLMGRNGAFNILSGPLTDGMVLFSPETESADGWNGGILKLSGLSVASESDKGSVAWIRTNEDSLSVEIQQEIPKLDDPRKIRSIGETIKLESDLLVGVEKDIKALRAHVDHGSSALLCGGQGSGKTNVSKALANLLRTEEFYHVTYFLCSKLVTEETRVSTVKETLQRLFMQATWGARLGGKAVLVLDDLDKLCPAEQELQVGNDNARSRQISELLRALSRQYCGKSSNIALVATARGKDSLHNVIVGGHIMPETIELKAPDKATRRDILSALLGHKGTKSEAHVNHTPNGNPAGQSDGSWMDGDGAASDTSGSENRVEGISTDAIDLLEIAGRTDGYMPGDLLLLFSRARSEAMNRTILTTDDSSEPISLKQEDFDRALEGFVPASLRNVTLQSSSTTFSSIGGLRETRKTLLETLQYPTTYAPIFAQCPLRLRSGLLLYGYPGCGKTLLASAVAGECGLNFISVKGPEILNKYIGASEKSVRDLFERAQAAKPCVLFFDEFDSIAPKRGHDSTGVTDRVVNQLLTQMDGAEGLSGVYVLAATSRPDLIDPALLRPGRLDKSLLCDMPDQEDRLDILRALSGKLKISSQISDGRHDSPRSLHEVARRTHGYSGADLQAVIYNAHLEAIHDVLEDRTVVNGTKLPENTKLPKHHATRPSSSALANAGHHELIQFRFGVEEDKKAAAALIGARASTERAALLAKLEAQRAVKRRERELRRGASSINKIPQPSSKSEIKDDKEETEVVIEWKHIEKSLASTRSSISARERVKLQAIYNEFVQGRNGEMPNGQGPMEIGARSSLM